MNTQQSLRTLAFVVITLALAPQGFAAQGLPPGSIEMFNALDPAQKKILLDQYGLDANILDTQVRAERVQAPALGMTVTQLEQVKRCCSATQERICEAPLRSALINITEK